MDFLFAAIFLYVLHALARKYQVHERLLIPAAIAAVIAFAAMVGYDLTGPASDQWLLVYAAVGLPFLVLILILPWMNRRILYTIPN